MDDPSFYGFPTYGEGGNGALVKAAQDCGGAGRRPAAGRFDAGPRGAGPARASFVRAACCPGSARRARTVTCLYTLTPDRDFVVGPLPGHPAVLVGLGAGARLQVRADASAGCWPTWCSTAPTGSDISAFAPDRPALVEAGHPVSWLV